jgi:hypothetical protein
LLHFTSFLFLRFLLLLRVICCFSLGDPVSVAGAFSRAVAEAVPVQRWGEAKGAATAFSRGDCEVPGGMGEVERAVAGVGIGVA